jgi:SAM-dependent methyltransferase
MTEGRHISFEHHHALDGERRLAEQPPGPLLELVLAAQPRVVADLGCGTGYLALPLAERLPAGRVLCLDLEPRMLEVLRERAAARGLERRVETVRVDDPLRLPLSDGAVDAALLVNLYHELDGRAGYLAELRRALRPGGLLLVCDWRQEGDPDHGPRPQHRVPAVTARQELEGAGFLEVVEHDMYGNYWVIAASNPG